MVRYLLANYSWKQKILLTADAIFTRRYLTVCHGANCGNVYVYCTGDCFPASIRPRGQATGNPGHRLLLLLVCLCVRAAIKPT